MATPTLYETLGTIFPSEAWSKPFVDALGFKSVGISFSESADPGMVQLYSAVIACHEALKPALKEVEDKDDDKEVQDKDDDLYRALLECYRQFLPLKTSTLRMVSLDEDVKGMMARASTQPETAQKKQLRRLLSTTFTSEMDQHLTEIAQGFVNASESLKTFSKERGEAISKESRQLVDSVQKIAELSANKVKEMEWGLPVPDLERDQRA